MIVEKKIELSVFQKVFLEADDKDDNNTITVKSNSSRGTDYDAGDTTTVRPSSDNTDYDDTPEDDNDDTSTDNGDEATDTTNDNTDGDDGETTDYDEEDGDDGANGDTDDGETTDYDEEDGGGDEESSDDSQNNSSNESNNDIKKKFSMYQKYMKLYKNVGIYNDRIQNTVKDDPIANTVLKTVSRNLTDLHDNLYDFMTLKFQNATYIQILTFFETTLSIVKLNFELLRNNRINLKQ